MSKLKRRAGYLILIAFTLSVAVALILYALRQNINLYLTPSELSQLQPKPTRIIKVGGVVKNKSIHIKQMTTEFVITDLKQEIMVAYQGILPGLFAEGKGVIVQGQLDQQGTFQANEVLAKHDENYRPPGVS